MDALSSRLIGMLLAIGLSTTLWILIVNQQNPEVTSEFAQPIQVQAENVPQDLVLASDLPQVQVTISAPQDHWPRIRGESFRAWVDLRDGSRGTREYPIRVTTTDNRVHIERISPAAVTLRLDPIMRKEVPVRATVVGRPPEGYAVAEPEPRVTPDRVSVIGAQTVVDTVEEAQVVVRIDSARENISQSVKPVPVTAQGIEVRGVQVTPTTVLAELKIERQSASKVLPVRPELVGTVRPGYQIVSIDVNPPAVAVIGEPNVIDGLTALSTAPVDVRNSQADIIRPVDVLLPPGVSQVRREQVTVHVGIRPQEGSQVFRVAPVAQNVPEGLEVAFDRPAVSVRLAGPEPTLTTLPPEEIRVMVDLTDLVTGTYTLTPTVSVPPPLRVLSVDPSQLDVTLR